jgi:hypothetical protein
MDGYSGFFIHLGINAHFNYSKPVDNSIQGISQLCLVLINSFCLKKERVENEITNKLKSSTNDEFAMLNTVAKVV